MRPILAENGGWAIFNFTPNGKNHGWDLLEMAKNNPDWYTSVLTLEDTKAYPLSIVEEERRAGMSEEKIQQEYYCSFDTGIVGSYYAAQMRQAEKENRITNVPYSMNIPVDTYWDLGIGDAMAIWFVQQVGKEIRFIDYLEGTGESVDYYRREMQNKGYYYGKHFWPHDGAVRELTTGKSRQESAQALGLRPIQILPAMNVDDGINAGRMIFNQCWFDKEKCKRGLDCLRNYCKDWDEKRKEFKSYPRHDWSSHGADAFRQFAIGFKERKIESGRRERPIRRETSLRMA